MTDQPTQPTLLDHLLQRYPTAKRQTLKRMVEAGRVSINGTPARRLKDPLPPNPTITISDALPSPSSPPRSGRTDPAPLPSRHQTLDLLHDDPDLLVVNKPAGLLTSTVPNEKRPTLLALVQSYVRSQDRAARVGLIHRLDRDASGLLVFSKNNDAYRSLKYQLAQRTMARVYAAIVTGHLPEDAGTIDKRLIELPDGRVVVTRISDKGESATTHFQVLARRDGKTLLRVTLETGRKHQIRAHLAARACPILGDRLYGGPPAPRLMLAATELAFDHPRTARRLTFTTDLPQPLRDAIRDS